MGPSCMRDTGQNPIQLTLHPPERCRYSHLVRSHETLLWHDWRLADLLGIANHYTLHAGDTRD